jgi:hypothetical protein
MIFTLSEEQSEFQKSVRRFFSEQFPSDKIRQLIVEDKTGVGVVLDAIRSLGLSELYGDSASAPSGITELIILARECGRHLIPDYLVQSLVTGPLLCSTFLLEQDKHSLDKQFGAGFCEKIRVGAVPVALAPRYLADQILSAESTSDVLRLMPFDRAARHALFVGRSSITLVETEIVAREQVLDITLPRSSVKVRSAVTVGGEAQHQLFRLLEVLLAAEIVGACERAVELVIGYAQTRKQFGKPIAAFQVVQHDLADIHLLVETFDSMLSIAIHGLSSEAGRSELAVAALLRALERDAVGLVERVIQIHGGIGFTWEHDAHLYLRRVMSQVALLGDSVKDSAAFLSLARLSA